MTTKQKLERIDAYLAEDNIHPQWAMMIREYRDILKTRQHPSGTPLTTQEAITIMENSRLTSENFTDEAVAAAHIAALAALHTVQRLEAIKGGTA